MLTKEQFVTFCQRAEETNKRFIEFGNILGVSIGETPLLNSLIDFPKLLIETFNFDCSNKIKEFLESQFWEFVFTGEISYCNSSDSKECDYTDIDCEKCKSNVVVKSWEDFYDYLLTF